MNGTLQVRENLVTWYIFMVFTIYQTFPENPVGSLMEHDFLGRSSGTFPGATENVFLFFRAECSKRNFVLRFSKAIS